MDITLESLITRIILHASLIRKNKEYDHSRVACAFEEIAAALNMVNQFRDAAKMVPTGAKSATPPKQKKCTFCGGEGWWMDAMGTNSYRCDECQNPAVSDHIVEANKMVPVVKDSLTTQIDTPLTDDQFRDTTKMVPTLEPCPFCGVTVDDSEIIEPTTDCFEPSLALHTWEHGDNHRTYLVQCARCECNGPPSYDHVEALNLWNIRK